MNQSPFLTYFLGYMWYKNQVAKRKGEPMTYREWLEYQISFF